MKEKEEGSGGGNCCEGGEGWAFRCGHGRKREEKGDGMWAPIVILLILFNAIPTCHPLISFK